MISERLLYAARRGFAADTNDLKSLIAQTARLNNRPYKNDLPSDDAVRLFRSRHRELTLRNYEAKDKAKPKGERFEHVEPFYAIVEKIGSEHYGLLTNVDLIWNIDETKVDAEYGKRVKVFSDANSHRGGSRAAAGGSGRHVTAVVAASASGRVCPPFFIVEGKNVMSSWFEPLDATQYKGLPVEVREHTTRVGWFPKNGVVVCSENGSMDMNILPLFIQHINKFVRQFVPPETSYITTLDGHGSRKGIEWVELCTRNNCEVVLAPANTSHFMQPCDQDVNKTFATQVRSIRDELRKCAITDTKSIQVKLMCGSFAFKKVSVQDCVFAFCRTGLFPFQRNFAARFKAEVIDLCDSDYNEMMSEASVVERAKEILCTVPDPSRALQRLTILLQNCHTTNDVIMGLRAVGSGGSSPKRAPNVALICGAPAEHITVHSAIEMRKEKIEREARKSLRKPGIES